MGAYIMTSPVPGFFGYMGLRCRNSGVLLCCFSTCMHLMCGGTEDDLHDPEFDVRLASLMVPCMRFHSFREPFWSILIHFDHLFNPC